MRPVRILATLAGLFMTAWLVIGAAFPVMASASVTNNNLKCYSASYQPGGEQQPTVVTTASQPPAVGQTADTSYNVKPPNDCPQPPGCPPRTYNGYQGPPSPGCCPNQPSAQYGNNDHCPSPPPGCQPDKYQPQEQGYGHGCCVNRPGDQYGNNYNDHCPSPPPGCQPDKYQPQGQRYGQSCCVNQPDGRYTSGNGCCYKTDSYGKYGAQPRCTVPVVYHVKPPVSPNYKCTSWQVMPGYVYYNGYCYKYLFLTTVDGYQYAQFVDRQHHEHQISRQYIPRKHCYGRWYVN